MTDPNDADTWKPEPGSREDRARPWRPCACGKQWYDVHKMHAHDCPCPPVGEGPEDRARIGRPPRAGVRATKRVELRATEDELEQWRALAEGAGLTLSAWIREQIARGV